MGDSRTVFSHDGLDIVKVPKRIRLIKILPYVNDADQVACTLEVVDLEPGLRYAAISYVWGDPSVKRGILLNNKQFYITENLHSALWYIRKNNMLQHDNSEQLKNFPLWVDAVCINQNSIEGRNQQVPMMGSIYGSASRVIYWLIRLEEGVAMSGHTAIAAIQEMTEAAFPNGLDLDQDSLQSFLTAHEGLSVPFAAEQPSQFDSMPPVWQSIMWILYCEFWGRVWINPGGCLANF